jgi:S1-C subfamily serine protease
MDPTTQVEPDWFTPEEGAGGEDAPVRRNSKLSGAALVLAGVVVGGLAVHALGPGASTTTTTAVQSPQSLQNPQFQDPQFQDPQSQQVTGSGPSNAASIAREVDAAVVDINTTLGYEQGQAAGTGVVVTSTGEVLTNNHVISGATKISVTDVGNGKTYSATVVGYDKSADLAVLQLSGASGLSTITPATTAVQPGAGVVGVGNAGGTGGTGGTPSYAAGVVTATDQPITASDAGAGTSEQLTGLIETDADIVAGDSGGPLVNSSGQVVGIDTAASEGFRFSRTSQAFAIPIATALRVARQIESGQASRTVHLGPTAMLGVAVRPSDSGAVVEGALAGGPAAAAGLTGGDTIVAVAGQTIDSADDLSRVILEQTPGTKVTVRYLDGAGRTHTTSLRLASGPPQ